jgi:phosphoserine phosphatase
VVDDAIARPAEAPAADTASLLRLLEEALASAPGDVTPALAFDGDGTLWKCDVGEWAFADALDRKLLGPEPLDALRQAAASAGLAEDGDQNVVGRRIVRAYCSGVFPEDLVCEVMVWGYAGWTEDELRSHARQTQQRHNLAARLNRELEPILDWASVNQVRTIIVSASPQLVVEEAARHLGFEAKDVIGGVSAVDEGRIAARMAAPLPYGPKKRTLASARLGAPRWLGAFGDSAFDMELLEQARVPVLVNPKQALTALAARLDHAVTFTATVTTARP